MKKQVLVIGGGFAGLRAARELAEIRDRVNVTLIDANPYTTMVPSLPDLAGTRIPADYLTEKIEKLVAPGIDVVTSKVHHVNLKERMVFTEQRVFTYDYAILATGSVTNFFGFNQHLESIFTLDSLDDGKRIARQFSEYLARAKKPKVIVSGGGYTGLELGCNLRYCSNKLESSCEISIVELKNSILSGMPDEIRSYMEDQCRKRNFNLLTGRSIRNFDGTNAELSDGTRFDDVFLCWSTGTKFGLDLEGNHESIKDGRIIVDECLRVPQHPEVFAAGDAAAMSFGSGYLRKAVNFSIYSGGRAGRNVVRGVLGKTPRAWSPKDLGWIIPFCDTATGKLLSKYTVRGRFPLALHYFMCGFRNYNRINRHYYYRMALSALRHKA